MMHRHATIAVLFATLLAGCAKQESPPATTQAPPAAAPAEEPATNDPNVTRARLTAGGVTASYAAHFENDKLVRIEEERHAQSGAALDGEYTYQGARLMQYRGAKLAAPATLELTFDVQGALLSGQGPDVTTDDVAAIRNRAQLLRSHALAQRTSRGHGSY